MYLERACKTFIIYKETIKRLFTLLKEGGLIILVHDLNQTYHVHNEHPHSVLPLSRTRVIDILSEAGFEDIHDESESQEINDVADGNVIMVITAFKPKTST